MARPHDDFGSTYRVPEHAPPGFASRRGGPAGPTAPSPTGDDVPEGFGPRSGPNPLGFTLQDCEFMYKAPDGKEHGPVPIAKILRWKSQNYFQDDVEIRPMGPWTTVGELAAKLGPAAAGKAAAADAGGTSAPAAASKQERGSGGGRQNQQQSGSSQGQQQQAAAAAPSEDKQASNQAAEKLFTAGATSAEQQPYWWYVDQVNKVQGPFPASDMVSWYAAAYFDHHIKMASTPRKGDQPPNTSAFKRLGALLSGPKQSAQQASKVIELISEEEFEAYGSPAADSNTWGPGRGQGQARKNQGGPGQGQGGQGQSRGGGGGPGAGAGANSRGGGAQPGAPGQSQPQQMQAQGNAAAAAAMYAMPGFGQPGPAAAAAAAAAQLAAFNAAGPATSGSREVNKQVQMQMAALQQMTNAQMAGQQAVMAISNAAAANTSGAGSKSTADQQRLMAQEVMSSMQDLMAGAGGQEQGGRQGQSQQQMLNQQAKMMAAQWGNAWGVPPGTSGAKAPAAHEQYGGWS